ncbi:MAG: hypothetical protein AAGN46_05055 [Acidobacteriota bacterium]
MSRAGVVVASPRRPGPLEERLASWLFAALAPRLSARSPADPPPPLAPFEPVEIPRGPGLDPLPGTWYPSVGPARGATLLAPPWSPLGQMFFHRYGRVPALREAGFDVLTFEFGGFAARSRRRPGFLDLDAADALAELRRRAEGRPLTVWGVSAGGYWLHPVLSSDGGRDVVAAFFEDVSSHFITWSKRMMPKRMPAFLYFQTVYRSAYRFLDLGAHAAQLARVPAAYVGGALDRGVPAAETRDLARLAGARCLIVDDADHLQAIRRDPRGLLDLALETFEVGLQKAPSAGTVGSNEA